MKSSMKNGQQQQQQVKLNHWLQEEQTSKIINLQDQYQNQLAIVHKTNFRKMYQKQEISDGDESENNEHVQEINFQLPAPKLTSRGYGEAESLSCITSSDQSVYHCPFCEIGPTNIFKDNIHLLQHFKEKLEKLSQKQFKLQYFLQVIIQNWHCPKIPRNFSLDRPIKQVKTIQNYFKQKSLQYWKQSRSSLNEQSKELSSFKIEKVIDEIFQEMEIYEIHLILIDIFGGKLNILSQSIDQSINLANPFRLIFLPKKSNSINFLQQQENFQNYEEQIIQLNSKECQNHHFYLTNILNSSVQQNLWLINDDGYQDINKQIFIKLPSNENYELCKNSCFSINDVLFKIEKINCFEGLLHILIAYPNKQFSEVQITFFKDQSYYIGSKKNQKNMITIQYSKMNHIHSQITYTDSKFYLRQYDEELKNSKFKHIWIKQQKHFQIFYVEGTEIELKVGQSKEIFKIQIGQSKNQSYTLDFDDNHIEAINDKMIVSHANCIQNTKQSILKSQPLHQQLNRCSTNPLKNKKQKQNFQPSFIFYNTALLDSDDSEEEIIEYSSNTFGQKGISELNMKIVQSHIMDDISQILQFKDEPIEYSTDSKYEQQKFNYHNQLLNNKNKKKAVKSYQDTLVSNQEKYSENSKSSKKFQSYSIKIDMDTDTLKNIDNNISPTFPLCQEEQSKNQEEELKSKLLLEEIQSNEQKQLSNQIGQINEGENNLDQQQSLSQVIQEFELNKQKQQEETQQNQQTKIKKKASCLPFCFSLKH